METESLNSSSSIEEIGKESFDKAVNRKSSDITLLGEVKNRSSWIKSTFLGRGSYGSVYLASSSSSSSTHQHTIVAIKSAEISKASSLMYEKTILTSLVSPFVVRCYGDEIARESTLFGGERVNYNLILEYCSGGSLAGLLQANGGRGLPEKYVRVFAKSILYGLLYVHSNNIIHCDIKPDNILLNRVGSNGYLAKIGDFGLALVKGSVEYGNGTGHKRGTTTYMAPELIRYGVVDYGVDTWAFGCTVLEMLTGIEAWGEYNGLLESEELVKHMGQSGCIPFIPDWLSVEARDFLRRCLVAEAGSRWEIGSLINHPFCNLEVGESHNLGFYI